MDTLKDIMVSIAGEKAATKGEKKHYIPFDVAEFNSLRVAFTEPNLMPNDIKLVLLAIADGKLKIVKA